MQCQPRHSLVEWSPLCMQLHQIHWKIAFFCAMWPQCEYRILCQYWDQNVTFDTVSLSHFSSTQIEGGFHMQCLINVRRNWFKMQSQQRVLETRICQFTLNRKSADDRCKLCLAQGVSDNWSVLWNVISGEKLHDLLSVDSSFKFLLIDQLLSAKVMKMISLSFCYSWNVTSSVYGDWVFNIFHFDMLLHCTS